MRASRSGATSRSVARPSSSPTTRRVCPGGGSKMSDVHNPRTQSAMPGTGTDNPQGSVASPARESVIPGVSYREMEQSYDVAHFEHPEHDELLTLNFGPHHPATHGVLRLITTLEGEVVRDVKPVIGYVHTGIEKNCEDKAYWKVIPLIERMDYLSYYFNAMAYCGAVETLAEIEVPPRAQYLRVIHLELNRIASHLLWLATGA